MIFLRDQRDREAELAAIQRFVDEVIANPKEKGIPLLIRAGILTEDGAQLTKQYRDDDELRAAQARAVMPLIGPLIDAWEAVCPSDQAEIDDISPSLVVHLDAIRDAMDDV